MGCYEISLGDTIGVGTPGKVQRDDRGGRARGAGGERSRCTSTTPTARRSPTSTPRWRCGVATFDSSVAGLGGCPYAKGATGNVATEDVVYMLDGLGIETGVDLDEAVRGRRFICDALGREPTSKVAKALAAKRAA